MRTAIELNLSRLALSATSNQGYSRSLPGHNMPAIPCSDYPATSYGLGGRGAHLVIPSLIAPILACFLVANRVYWRLRMLGMLGSDDVSTVLAVVSLKFATSRSFSDDLPGIPRCAMYFINSRSGPWLWKTFPRLE